MSRNDSRKRDELRKLSFHRGVSHPSQLSIQVEWGKTIVLCGVSIDDTVPRFLKGSGKGWLTSEYAMLPLSSDQRIFRDRDRINGRVVEIQRLIGRCLRSMVDLSVMGERTVLVDCDVLSADGGTRTASITGASLALQILLHRMIQDDLVPANALRFGVAAVSLGFVKGELLLDLNYSEDSTADADFNLVMNDKKELIEIQGCAEGTPFSRNQLVELIEVGHKGIAEVIQKQKQYLQEIH